MNLANYIVMHVNKNDKSYLFMIPDETSYDDAHEVLVEVSAQILEMKRNAIKPEGVTE